MSIRIRIHFQLLILKAQVSVQSVGSLQIQRAKYIQRLRKNIGAPVSIEVGYEAGPIGSGLKSDLEKAGIKCHVMVPTSIYRPAGGVRVKTDVRDARVGLVNKFVQLNFSFIA